MTDVFKVLAQVIPLAGVLTDAYTPSKPATISTMLVCNQSPTLSAKFRISIAIAGAVDNPKQYLYYDAILGTNKTFAATIGITLAATDVIRVLSDIDTVSFNAFGVEIT